MGEDCQGRVTPPQHAIKTTHELHLAQMFGPLGETDLFTLCQLLNRLSWRDSMGSEDIQEGEGECEGRSYDPRYGKTITLPDRS